MRNRRGPGGPVFNTYGIVLFCLEWDGSRGPIQFHISNDYDKHPIDVQVVQAATKWKRVALISASLR